MNIKKYEYLLFDWDGTIAKTLDIWLEALRVSLEKHGHFLSDKEIGANFEALKERLESKGYLGVQPIIDEADKIASSNIPAVKIYPGAIEVLRILKSSNKKLGIVTTSMHADIDPLLRTHRIDSLFEVVICGDDVTRQKPNPEPILKALQALNGDPRRTVMVGDSEKDIEAATNAGIDSGLFYPVGHERFYDIAQLQQLKPTFIIQDFKELLPVV